MLRRPENAFLQARLGTDGRKPVVLSVQPSTWWSEEGARDWSLGLGLEFRPASNVSVELDPRVSHSESTDPFVTTVDEPMATELFGQPFISSNDFGTFKQFEAPRRLEKEVFSRDAGTIRSEGEGFDEVFVVDPDGGGPAEEFSFDQRGFTFASLRGNAVLRWEYTPGSTLFFVWTRDRSSLDPTGDLRFRRDASDIFEAEGDHVFLGKATCWLGL